MNSYGVFMAGEGGKDIISTKLYEGIEGYAPDAAGVYVWGDWDYGSYGSGQDSQPTEFNQVK